MVGTRYPILPLPHIPAQTEMIELGPIAIGIGHRVLDDQTAGEYLRSVGYNPRPEEGERGYGNQGMEDGGVCIHVFGRGRGGADWVEYFRFDCFEDEPHYHYVYPDEKAQRRVFLDPVLEGDPQEWALERLRTRLPEILRSVGAAELASRVDPVAIEAALPRVREAIARAERASRRSHAGAA
jgi:hypothetical protein